MIKRIFCSSLVILLFCGLLFADEIDDFNKVVDFSVTLKTLNKTVSENKDDLLTGSEFIIITGSVATRQVIEKDKENFLGEIEIVQGEWIGVESVKMYKCIVQFSGSQYYSMIPARRSRKINKAEIILNSNVMIAGKFIGVREVDNLKIPVIDGYYIRTLN